MRRSSWGERLAGRVASVTTLRAPLSMVEAFVHYHRRIGVRPIYLFFDEPSDAAADALEGQDGVRVYRCDETHWRSFSDAVDGETLSLAQKQSLNATRALQLAREDGAAWLAHIDHDELLYPEDGNLGTALAAADPGCDAVRLRAFEAVAERLRCELPFREVELFRVLGSVNLSKHCWLAPALERWLQSLQRVAARAIGCGAVLFRGEYFRGYPTHKSITRTSSPRVERIFVHSPLPHPGERLRVEWAPRLHVLHFESSTFESWVEKWARRMDGSLMPRMRANRARQRDLFRAAYLSGGPGELEDLYRRLYLIPGELRPRLTRLGMLRRVQLPADAFHAPGPSVEC